jgi:NTP pyrophosphatase (non-canonical NTP hydrolase)
MDIVQNMTNDDIKEEIEDESTDVENHCLTLVPSNGEDHNER